MVRLTEEERSLLQELRKKRPARFYKKSHEEKKKSRTTGQAVADGVASAVGSWKFIIIQSVILVLWMAANVVAYAYHWDPYPFILLNLVLSFQAAFTAPVIMMSQNRQSERDRLEQQHDFDINIKAELEIEALHQKVDLLRDVEILKLIDVIEKLRQRLDASEGKQE